MLSARRRDRQKEADSAGSRRIFRGWQTSAKVATPLRLARPSRPLVLLSPRRMKRCKVLSLIIALGHACG
jgi:hypothetical protein